MPRKNQTTKDLKEREFAKVYVREGFNATEATMQVMKPKNRNVARNMGALEVAKSSTRKHIRDVLEEGEVDNGLITKYLKRNIKQKSKISGSNQAIDIYMKATGQYAPERKESIHLEITESNIDDKLKEITEGIEALKDKR